MECGFRLECILISFCELRKDLKCWLDITLLVVIYRSVKLAIVVEESANVWLISTMEFSLCNALLWCEFWYDTFITIIIVTVALSQTLLWPLQIRQTFCVVVKNLLYYSSNNNSSSHDNSSNNSYKDLKTYPVFGLMVTTLWLESVLLSIIVKPVSGQYRH